MKYTWIDRNRAQRPIALACEVLGVSARGGNTSTKEERKALPQAMFLGSIAYEIQDGDQFGGRHSQNGMAYATSR